MADLSQKQQQIQYVTSFRDLVAVPFSGAINAACWARELKGDFSEIVKQIKLSGNITEITREDLLALRLSMQGQLARSILLDDFKLLEAHGASPVLNVISHYERDDTYSIFPTDVYSFHADRSPIPTDTFLCTYYGACSEILPNAASRQKVLIPALREELKEHYHGAAEDFNSFLMEHFFDLHYEAVPGANPITLGLGHLCRLAVDYPGSPALPCVHRAPVEKPGQHRLLMIC